MNKEGKQDYFEMVEFCTMKNVFHLPEEARWAYRCSMPNKVICPFESIKPFFGGEKNPTFKGTLPDNYFSLLNLDASKLAALLDAINNIDTVADPAADVAGRVYEYFLG